MSDLGSEVRDLEVENRYLEVTVIDLNSEIDRLREQNENQQVIIYDLQEEISELEVEINDLKSGTGNGEAELLKIYKDRINGLEVKLKNSEADKAFYIKRSISYEKKFIKIQDILDA